MPLVFILAAAVLLAASAPVGAATIRVPADEPTIEAGLAAAVVGDSVIVACGTYSEADLLMKSGVVLRSETGDPTCVIIDAELQGTPIFCRNTNPGTRIEGVTLTGGGPDHEEHERYGGGMTANFATVTITDCVIADNEATYGGGLHIVNGSSVTLIDCSVNRNRALGGAGLRCLDSELLVQDSEFIDNTAVFNGGAMMIAHGDAVLERCKFWRNSATRLGAGGADVVDATLDVSDSEFLANEAGTDGGALRISGTTAEIADCLFVDNAARRGGVFFNASTGDLTVRRSTLNSNQATDPDGGSAVYFEGPTQLFRSILSFGKGVPASCSGGSINLYCCDVYGNAGGNYTGCLVGLGSSNGNFSGDPLYCDKAAENYFIRSSSPCAPPGVMGCGLVGAFGVACGPVSLAPRPWGWVKQHYR